MKTNERYLQALREMNSTMVNETKSGLKWRYSNSSSKQAHTFQLAMLNKKRYTNCCLGVWWGLRIAGVPDAALHWYGLKGGKIKWQNGNAKAEAEKYFEIIPTGGKTVKQLYNGGDLCDGDILLGYQAFGHTNSYIGGGQSFDSGHAFCKGSGEGAIFKKWIGGLTCKANKVNYIFRLRDRAHYRVQAGAYADIMKYHDQAALLRSKGFPCTMIQEDRMYKCQVGYFDGKTNADNLVAKLQRAGISAFAKEV